MNFITGSVIRSKNDTQYFNKSYNSNISKNSVEILALPYNNNTIDLFIQSNNIGYDLTRWRTVDSNNSTNLFSRNILFKNKDDQCVDDTESGSDGGTYVQYIYDSKTQTWKSK